MGKRPYEVGPLEALLKKEFGEDTTMGKLPPTPRILVTGEIILLALKGLSHEIDLAFDDMYGSF